MCGGRAIGSNSLIVADGEAFYTVICTPIAACRRAEALQETANRSGEAPTASSSLARAPSNSAPRDPPGSNSLVFQIMFIFLCVSAARRVQACSNCREVGHNKKTCPQRAAAGTSTAVHVAGSAALAAGMDSAPRFRPPPIQPIQPPPVVAPGVFACTLHVRVCYAHAMWSIDRPRPAAGRASRRSGHESCAQSRGPSSESAAS